MASGVNDRQDATPVNVAYAVEAASICPHSPDKRRRVDMVKASGCHFKDLAVPFLQLIHGDWQIIVACAR
jgi:hypothetical protein